MQRTGCAGCLFHAPGVLCLPQVHRKLINRAPGQRGALMYTKLNTYTKTMNMVTGVQCNHRKNVNIYSRNLNVILVQLKTGVFLWFLEGDCEGGGCRERYWSKNTWHQYLPLNKFSNLDPCCLEICWTNENREF